MIFLYNTGVNLVSFLVLSRYGVINLSFYVVSHTESRGGDGVINYMQRCCWHREGQRCSVQLRDDSWGKRFVYNL